ncbi:MAG: UDP-glucose 4-epimerase GalE, partial [Bacilli bacterium]|nr:UDP-glucose 4-epimerase GalE [Bacilli bacterium]
MKVLVTGGTGYIGSHTCVELLNNNYEVVIIDNLCNSKKEVVDKIEKITGKKVKFYENDVCDANALRKIFKEQEIDAVIHFAGLKAVGESISIPLAYYRNNLDSTLALLEVMKEFNCKNLVFSSSATVYGNPGKPEYDETMPRVRATSPYGATKAMIECILEDLYTSDSNWKITILRYFNPIGAHKSGLIGENPNGIPNNLMPYILKVAIGELPELTIFGNDYNTPDGTCIRDFIHVVDLAKGHIKALEHAIKSDNKIYIYNLGSGHGVSVQELITTFEKTNKIKLNYKVGPRRVGDLPSFWANANLALKELGWKTEETVETMCRDSYNFIQRSKEEN